MDVVIAAVSVAVAMVIREGVAAVIRIRTTNSDVDRRDRKDETADERRQKKETRDALREYIDLKEKDYEARGKQLSDLQEKFDRYMAQAERQHRECLAREAEAARRNTRAETRIEALEDALRERKIPFRQYDPDQSDRHRPVQPDPPEDPT